MALNQTNELVWIVETIYKAGRIKRMCNRYNKEEQL